MPRYWSEISVLVCLALLITSSAIAAISMRIEPLFVSICVIVVGSRDAGAVGLALPGGDQCCWDSLLLRALACARNRRFRSRDALAGTGNCGRAGPGQRLYPGDESARNCAKPRTRCAAAIRNSSESEEKFRQIFQQSGDMVVVSNLETSAILEVNNQFVKRSGVPRELVAGTQRCRVQFFCGVSQSARNS